MARGKKITPSQSKEQAKQAHLCKMRLHTRPQQCLSRIQVSRLCFILLGRLPIDLTVTCCLFVSFTVTGLARKFHPIPSAVSSRHLPVQTHESFNYEHYIFLLLKSQSILGQVSSIFPSIGDSFFM